MNDTQYNDSDVEYLFNIVSRTEFILIATTMIIICVITLVGNTLVVISFIFDKKLRTHNNYFLLSLAASDIMIAFFSMPIFTLYVLNGDWILGPVVCDMWLAQDYMCSSASGLNLLLISLDRYLSVTRPLQYRAKRRGKHVAMMISSVWILSFLIWPIWIYAWPYIDGERIVPDEDCYVQFLETNTYLTIVTAVISYYVPISLMCIIYFRIWRETEKRKQYLTSRELNVQRENAHMESKGNGKKQSKERSKFFSCCRFNYSSADRQNSKSSNATDFSISVPSLDSCRNSCVSKYNHKETPELATNDNSISPSVSDCKKVSKENVQLRMSSLQNTSVKHDHKAARTLTSILLAFIVTATPYNVIVIIQKFDYTYTLVSLSMWNFCYFLFYVNSTLNPVCYALANANFRKTYWKILTCMWCKSRKNSNLNLKANKLPQNKNHEEAKFLTSTL